MSTGASMRHNDPHFRYIEATPPPSIFTQQAASTSYQRPHWHNDSTPNNRDPILQPNSEVFHRWDLSGNVLASRLICPFEECRFGPSQKKSWFPNQEELRYHLERAHSGRSRRPAAHPPRPRSNAISEHSPPTIPPPPLPHFEFPPRARDPYKSLGVLGQGAYGFVDKVERRHGGGQALARKLSILPARGLRREVALKSMQEEARIAASLEGHPHIVKVVETFQWGNRFGIVMLPVADCNLAEYLEEVDHMQHGAERQSLIRHITRMSGCLIRALDYIHSRGVKHKDIKPSNILLWSGRVFLTDFGIARDLSDLETTGTTGDPGARSKMYCPPEANSATARRGRSADVFSLGCVFLELTTVLCAEAGLLQSSKNCLNTGESGSDAPAYSNCTMQVVQWLQFLWSTATRRRILTLTVLMLHPDPESRPCSSDLVTIFSVLIGNDSDYWCDECSPCLNERDHDAFDNGPLGRLCERIWNVFRGSSLSLEKGVETDYLVALGWTRPGSSQTSSSTVNEDLERQNETALAQAQHEPSSVPELLKHCGFPGCLYRCTSQDVLQDHSLKEHSHPDSPLKDVAWDLKLCPFIQMCHRESIEAGRTWADSKIEHLRLHHNIPYSTWQGGAYGCPQPAECLYRTPGSPDDFRITINSPPDRTRPYFRRLDFLVIHLTFYHPDDGRYRTILPSYTLRGGEVHRSG